MQLSTVPFRKQDYTNICLYAGPYMFVCLYFCNHFLQGGLQSTVKSNESKEQNVATDQIPAARNKTRFPNV